MSYDQPAPSFKRRKASPIRLHVAVPLPTPFLIGHAECARVSRQQGNMCALPTMGSYPRLFDTTTFGLGPAFTVIVPILIPGFEWEPRRGRRKFKLACKSRASGTWKRLRYLPVVAKENSRGGSAGANDFLSDCKPCEDFLPRELREPISACSNPNSES